MSSQKKFYITTPIYYVNDQPHLGHLYTTVAADVLARYHRLLGEEVFYLTGTDEHGAKIEEKAKENGLEPQEFVDGIVAKFQSAWKDFNIDYDKFIRTTDKKHIETVQKALQHLYDKGDIYKGKYEGLYCRGCEQYKSQKDLVNGKCPDHNQEAEMMSEECYMFKLSKYSPQILKKIKSDEFKILPVERKNEVVGFYKEDLRDVAFSRKNVKWGIPLPWNKEQTAYVWADAFLNYLTGLGWTGEAGKAPAMWPAEVQLMAKDILRVHATIWPAMLLSLGLPLPKEFFVHGFFLVDGKKMSKTLGNVITPEELKKKYGVDAARYLLMAITPFGNDGDISWERLDEKYNAELANDLGNLVNRVILMVKQFNNSEIPKDDNFSSYPGFRDIYFTKEYFSGIENYFDNLQLDAVIKKIFSVIKDLNKGIGTYEPFKMDKEFRDGFLSSCLESIRIIAWLILPFMPETADKIFSQLGLDPIKEKSKKFREAIKWGGLKPGTKIKKGEPLFPRLK